jgi:hypothetical protein
VKVNNSTNWTKLTATAHLKALHTLKKMKTRHTALEIQVPAWDSQTNPAGLNRLSYGLNLILNNIYFWFIYCPYLYFFEFG